MISDHASYLKIALFIGNEATLSDDRLHELAVTKGSRAERVTVGRDISLSQISNTCKAGASKSRNGPPDLYYKVVSPPLAALIGGTIAARLMSSCQYFPASTVQISAGSFPHTQDQRPHVKHGLICHSSFIGTRKQGRISRFLANECSVASRIDNFSQVEE